MNYYAKGGEAHGIKSLAKELPKYGRYGDTIVAHINPQEAALLKAMGGSGTINPVTGLPEFFLKSVAKAITKPVEGVLKGVEKAVIRPIGDVLEPILPYVQYVAPFIPGIGTAAAVGLGALGSGFAGGGGFNLKRGIMGGITAYGMSNLAQGLSAAGNPSAAASGATTPPPVELGVPGTDVVAGEVARTGLTEPGIMSQLGAGDISGAVSNIASSGADAVRTGVNALTNPETYKSLGDSLTTQGKGLTNLVSGDKAALSAFGDKFGVGSAGAIMMGTSGQAAINELEKAKLEADLQAAKSETERNEILARIEASRRRGEEAVRRNPYMFAYGGSVDDEPGTDDLSAGGIASMAAGGMTPRFLSGGGDGMSDDIPATINGTQPARLADGEFVVSSDVVSGLGNGSSKAGAKKLYAMMDRVRKARTGTKKQAPAVKAEKLLPA